MPGNGGSARISASPAARAVVKPPPAHYLHELPAQDEERLECLFQRLDLDGNGRIDVHDLSRALRDAGVHTQYAQVFIKYIHDFYPSHIKESSNIKERFWILLNNTVTSTCDTSAMIEFLHLSLIEIFQIYCINVYFSFIYFFV